MTNDCLLITLHFNIHQVLLSFRAFPEYLKGIFEYFARNYLLAIGNGYLKHVSCTYLQRWDPSYHFFCQGESVTLTIHGFHCYNHRGS